MMNPIEHSLESQFNKASTDKWLVERFNSGDQPEQTKSRWAIREAANNLTERFGLDRDSG